MCQSFIELCIYNSIIVSSKISDKTLVNTFLYKQKYITAVYDISAGYIDKIEHGFWRHSVLQCSKYACH